MKKSVLLLLLGCLVVSPVSFADEQIILAAAIGAGPSDGGPNGNDSTPNSDNRNAAYIPGQGGQEGGMSKETLTKVVVSTIGGVVAVAVLAVSGGGSHSTSSH